MDRTADSSLIGEMVLWLLQCSSGRSQCTCMWTAGMMDCLMRQGENGKHDRDLRLVEVGETAAVEAAASLVTCQIQVCLDRSALS